MSKVSKTLVLFVITSFVIRFYNAFMGIEMAVNAGLQFSVNDKDYIQFATNNSIFDFGPTLITLVFFYCLYRIWRENLLNIVKTLIMCMLIGISSNAYAFFDTTNRTEAYTVMPNESAFWIPDVGDNVTSQESLGSEEYLRKNKIPVKRFVIPHVKLSGTGGTAFFSGADYYVPTGRLIIVDRTPYSREWVDSSDRGTSARREGFPCQTNEGINVTAGISIGAMVKEEDSPRYLHNFGTVPPKGERNDPNVIFTSVYYSRSLASVMDDVGRKAVQVMVCREISSRDLKKVNSEAVVMLEKIRAEAIKYFAAKGITVDFIGWADTFDFDKDVQTAINNRFIAEQQKLIAEILAPHTGTIMSLTASRALERFADKSDGKLPTTVVGIPPSISNLLNGLFPNTGENK